MRMAIANQAGLWSSLRRSPCTAGMLAVIWSMFGVELLTHAIGHPEQLLRLGALPTAGIVRGEYWRLLTYALLHSAWWHIGLNTILLLMTGPVVERTSGARMTLVVSLSGAVLGGMAVLLVHRHDPASFEVGASGAFFALLAAALVLTWRHSFAPSARIYRRLRTVLIAGLAISFAPGVSLAAHVAGLVAGGACALAMRRWNWRGFHQRID